MIYIHVGFPKVASTTIQNFLFLNRELLKREGYLYPNLSKDGKSFEMGVSSRAHNALYVELRRGTLGATWQRLHQILDNREPGQNVILSGEGLIGAFPPDLRTALGDHEATILFYLRDFARILPSQYAHRAKQALCIEDFDAFFAQRMEAPQIRTNDFLGTWAEAFGPERIRVRMLDDRTLVGGDVCLDLLNAVDFATARPDLEGFAEAKTMNVGLGWKSVEILRDLHGSLSNIRRTARGKTARKEDLLARKRRIRSPLLDFAATLALPAARIGKEMGFTDRGLYLSATQVEEANSRFNTEVDLLLASDMDARVTHAPETGITPRDFLPRIEEIPHAEVAEFLRRLMPQACWRLLPPAE
ncbi:MAG: hypothetical protein ACU0A9_04850 [Alterinioella nitratireducens]|uniref:hypothetical protein n=1 Tax=Alterinioella nitratireducens TaxID=2735915 RepID=UPI004059E8C2